MFEMAATIQRRASRELRWQYRRYPEETHFSTIMRGAYDGLEAILRCYFAVPVRVEQFIGEWLEIPSEYRWQLGRGRALSALGETTVVGARSFQRSQKFRVALGPLSPADFQSFLPGTSRQRALAELIRMYVGDELAWDVRLRHESEQRPQLRLGRGSRVSYSAWLGANCRAGIGVEDLVLPAPVAEQ